MIYWQIFVAFLRFGLMSFGGMLGVLPELERTLVVQHHWITHNQFVQAFVVGQFVPGPNMAMCPLVGYEIAGVAGWAVAFVGIYSVPFTIMGVAYTLYRGWKKHDWVRRVETSLRPLVFGLILASAVLLFWEQAGPRPLLATVVCLAGWYLNSAWRVGAMTVMFGTGFVWWILTLGWPLIRAAL